MLRESVGIIDHKVQPLCILPGRRSIFLGSPLCLPVLFLLTPVDNQTIDIKWINERLEPRTRIVITRPLDLSHSILSQVDLVRFRQRLHGVEDIEQRGIAVHEDDLEEPEKPLLFEEGTDAVQIIVCVQACRGEVLHGTIDRPDGDECATGVEHDQRALDLVVQHPASRTVVVESSGQRRESYHQGNLHDQRCLEECLSCVLFPDCRVGACYSCSAIGGDGFDRDAQGDESGEDAAGVDGGVVWDVVEHAAEDEVVCTFVDGSA